MFTKKNCTAVFKGIYTKLDRSSVNSLISLKWTWYGYTFKAKKTGSRCCKKNKQKNLDIKGKFLKTFLIFQLNFYSIFHWKFFIFPKLANEIILFFIGGINDFQQIGGIHLSRKQIHLLLWYCTCLMGSMIETVRAGGWEWIVCMLARQLPFGDRGS